MQNEFSAGGVIYRKNNNNIEIAVILDSFGRWTFPKGHIEKKEKPEEAALRECQEETGLNNIMLASDLNKINFCFKDKWNKKGELIHKTVYYYLFQAPPYAKLIAQKKEIQDVKWISLDNLDKLETYKDNSKTIKKVLEYFSPKI